MLKVVSNSSPLIHLAKIGLLDLLAEEFGEILVPRAVWHETVEEGGGLPDSEVIAHASWIRILEAPPSPLLTSLLTSLDQGEAEAIALALDTEADMVLLDETEARQVTDSHGIRKTGVVGVLIRARRQGRIDSLSDVVGQLSTTGFHLTRQICQKALEAVGEGR